MITRIYLILFDIIWYYSCSIETCRMIPCRMMLILLVPGCTRKRREIHAVKILHIAIIAAWRENARGSPRAWTFFAARRSNYFNTLCFSEKLDQFHHPVSGQLDRRVCCMNIHLHWLVRKPKHEKRLNPLIETLRHVLPLWFSGAIWFIFPTCSNFPMLARLGRCRFMAKSEFTDGVMKLEPLAEMATGMESVVTSGDLKDKL